MTHRIYIYIYTYIYIYKDDICMYMYIYTYIYAKYISIMTLVSEVFNIHSHTFSHTCNLVMVNVYNYK